jgi:hypothetical protein
MIMRREYSGAELAGRKSTFIRRRTSRERPEVGTNPRLRGLIPTEGRARPCPKDTLNTETQPKNPRSESSTEVRLREQRRSHSELRSRACEAEVRSV